MLQAILARIGSLPYDGTKKQATDYTGSLLNSYSKNVFYYKHAFGHMRAGRENFPIPTSVPESDLHANTCMVRLFTSSFVTILLQDLLAKDIKLHIQQPQIVQEFKKRVQKRITTLVRASKDACLQEVYGAFDAFINPHSLVQEIQQYGDDSMITYLKEHFYTLDFRLYHDVIKALEPYGKTFQKHYHTSSIVGILALLRETLLGLCLYTMYLQQQKVPVDAIFEIYGTHVLQVHPEIYQKYIKPALEGVIQIYAPILTGIISIDDNE
ncbi:MAG: hypothetical protein WCJ81_01100 [bacterium]